jgi:hypothetical protein
MSDEMKRAICHEAGHAVVALHLGFHVEKIDVSGGFPRVICGLDSPEKSKEERFILLAGGIASETLYYGDFDQEASRRDQSMICDRGGGAIESYVSQALGILRLNECCLRRLRERLSVAWVKAAAEAVFEPGPDSFEILSQAEIDDIWRIDGKV